MFFNVNKVFMNQRKYFSSVKTHMGAPVCARHGERYPALYCSNHIQWEEKSFMFSKWGTRCGVALNILISSNIMPRRNYTGKKINRSNTQILETLVLNITKLKIYKNENIYNILS